MERWYWASVISLEERPARTVANTVKTIGVAVIMLFQMEFGPELVPADSGNESLGSFMQRSWRPSASRRSPPTSEFDYRLKLFVGLDRAWFEFTDPVDRDLDSGSFMDQVRGQHGSGAAQA